MIRERVRPARGPVPVRIGVRLDHAHAPSGREAVVVINHRLVLMRVVVLHIAHRHRLRRGFALAFAVRLLCFLLLLAPLLPKLLELCVGEYCTTDWGTNLGDQVSMSTTLHSIQSRNVPLGLRFGPCRCMVT